MLTDAQVQAAAVMQARPDLFVENALGGTIWSKQREILQSVACNERTAVRSCHGAGKSHIAARAVIWFMATHQPAEVVTTAPTWSQVEDVLWKEIHLAWGKAIPPVRALGICLSTELKFGDGHVAYGISTDKTDRFQGRHSPNLLVVVDEAAGVAPAIFDAVATLGTGEGYRELLIGNPTSTDGRFYQAFQNPALGYNCISISAEETPNFTDEEVPESVKRNLVTREWVEARKVDWGEDSPLYISRVKAEFPSGDADNVLVPLAWAEAACNLAPRTDGDATCQMGLDVARYGSDACCLAGRVGYNLKLLKSKPGHTGSLEVEAWARQEAQDFAAANGGTVKVLVDEGYNPGVVDHLLTLSDPGVTYEAVSFGAAARDPEKHLNRRNEMMWGLRELYRPGNADPDLCITATGPEVERLKSQVSSIRFKYDTRLRPKCETKQEMKDRGMPSPDETDAVALAFAESEQAVPWDIVFI